MQDFSVAGLDDVDPPVEAGAGVVLQDFTVADVDEDVEEDPEVNLLPDDLQAAPTDAEPLPALFCRPIGGNNVEGGVVNPPPPPVLEGLTPARVCLLYTSPSPRD